MNHCSTSVSTLVRKQSEHGDVHNRDHHLSESRLLGRRVSLRKGVYNNCLGLGRTLVCRLFTSIRWFYIPEPSTPHESYHEPCPSCNLFTTIDTNTTGIMMVLLTINQRCCLFGTLRVTEWCSSTVLHSRLCPVRQEDVDRWCRRPRVPEVLVVPSFRLVTPPPCSRDWTGLHCRVGETSIR